MVCREYAEEVWKVSVSTASNEGKESVTLRTLYHSMETMANAFSSQHLPSLDLNGESNSKCSQQGVVLFVH